MHSFDATLMVKGHESLVGNGRSLGKKGGSVAKRMGKRLTKPLNRFSAASIARYIISVRPKRHYALTRKLPLNLIPGLGTAIFLVSVGHFWAPLTLLALQRQPIRPQLPRTLLRAQEA